MKAYHILFISALLLSGCTDRATLAQLAAIQAKLDAIEKKNADEDRYFFHYTGIIQAKLDAIEKDNADEDRYFFHYAGKERFQNEIALYRLDKRTGTLERFVVQIADNDRASGMPAHEEITRLNLSTGESSIMIDSQNRELVQLWIKRQLNEKP